MSFRVAVSIDRYVGMAISARRKELGLSSIELSDRVRIDAATLRQLEDGTGRPSPRLLLALSDTLKVRVSYFFTGVANTRFEQKPVDRAPNGASLVPW